MDYTSNITVGMTHEAVDTVTDANTALTVGTSLNITHRAATPTGLTVRAVAEVTAVDGRAITLYVTAYDAREEIGTGTHTRFAVAASKFMAKAEGKRPHE